MWPFAVSTAATCLRDRARCDWSAIVCAAWCGRRRWNTSVVRKRAVIDYCWRPIVCYHGQLGLSQRPPAGPSCQVRRRRRFRHSFIGSGVLWWACLSVREHVAWNDWSKLNQKLFVRATCGRDSILICRCCDMLCTSGFADDVTFSHMGTMATCVVATPAAW